MVLSRHNAAVAVYQAAIDLDPVSKSKSVERTTFSLARLDSWITSVIELLVENEFRSGRRRKE